MTAIELEALRGACPRVSRRAMSRRAMSRRAMSRRAAPHRASATAGRMLATLRQWRRRAHARAELAALDDRMLADIGITRADAERLSNQPFWRE